MRATPLWIALVALAGCGKETPPPPNPPPRLAPWRVDVYPFSPEKTAVLEDAVRLAEERTKVRFRAAGPIRLVWDRVLIGGKVNSGALVQLVAGQARKLRPEDRVLAVIGVCDRDIGSGGTEPVFFASSKEDRAGVLSWYRLSNEAIGLPSDDALLGRRAGKLLVILAGRLLGLPRCASPSCIHAAPQGLPGLDALDGAPCASCRKVWESLLAK